MTGITPDKAANIEALVRLDCETYFQLTQQELADGIGVEQPTICAYKQDPYYQQCIVKWKSGKIGNMQLKSAELIDRTIQLGHDSIPMIDKAVQLVHDAENKTERENAFGIFKRVIRAFSDGKDMAQWLLEKTDSQYVSKLKHVHVESDAPEDAIPLPELDIESKIKTAQYVELPALPAPKDNGGNGSGNGA